MWPIGGLDSHTQSNIIVLNQIQEVLLHRKSWNQVFEGALKCDNKEQALAKPLGLTYRRAIGYVNVI